MTLSFSTQINGKPNYFIEKIHSSIYENNIIVFPNYIPEFVSTEQYFNSQYKNKFGKDWDCYKGIVNPKLHTIRKDEKNRWGAGCDIHFVINNRTPNRFQFAPVIKCKSVQRIGILHIGIQENGDFVKVYIDDKLINKETLEKLAINDGFDSAEDFFAYFNKDFTGVLIHWTDLKY